MFNNGSFFVIDDVIFERLADLEDGTELSIFFC